MARNNRRPGTSRPRWRLSLSSWLIIPVAMALGVLLFVMVWAQRQAVEDDAPTMLPAVEVDSRTEVDSLPAPQLSAESPEDESGAGGVFALPDAPAEAPALAPGVTPAPPSLAEEQMAAESIAAVADSAPVPVHAPAPAYPARSQRRGERGEVMVQAVVGPDGRPRQVEIARSSSYRALDQAALRAVRQWRFQPAVRRGEAVAETVQIPITFSP